MTERTIFRQALLSILAAPLLLSGGCGDSASAEESDFTEGIPSEVSFSISALTLKNGLTRADGIPVDPEYDNEKIKDWFLVFVDKNGKISKILHRSDAEAKVVDKNKPVEAETFRCILPSGTYSIYVFANMTEVDLKTASGITFQLNGSIDKETLAKEIWETELNLWNISEKAIPMTGYLGNVKIKNTIEETFSIEVVRMMAKVELRFANSGDSDITVNSVSLDPVTKSPVSLFPNGTVGISYDYLGEEAYTPIKGAVYDMLTYTPSSLTVKSGTSLDKPERCLLYIKESISKRDNDNAFTVGLSISHADGVTDYLQYNITSDIRGYINRNDWVMIPISLSQYDVKVEALFYPPIGGYPAFLSAVDPEGAQVFTFGTQGDFAIVPYVTDKQTGTSLSPQRYSIAFSEEDLYDPNGIFEKKPSMGTTSAGLPYEILGKLGTKEGKAVISMTVEIYDRPMTDPGAKVVQAYTRKIYILRDNKIKQ